LERLNTDKVYYEEMVTAAIHNRRPEIEPDYLMIELFERELQYAVERARA
jgi:hypothetical protein